MSTHRMRHTAAAAPAPSPVADQPGFHNFFMFGLNTLYVSHMPMFTIERHMYQVVLRASLPKDVIRTYQQGRRAAPAAPYNLVNSEDDPYALPELKSGRRSTFKADLYEQYSNAEAQPVGTPFAKDVPVQVEQIVHFRHFNFQIPRPPLLTYLLFGSGGEAHLSHYIARDPDYQHIVTLASAPDWLTQDQIEAGVELTISSLPSLPLPCANPLTAKSLNVTFQGWDIQQLELELEGAVSVWFSTGNMLNANDPCAATKEAGQ